MLQRCLLVCFLFCSPTVVLSAPFDWSDFDKTLKAHVYPGEYQGIKANVVDYPALLDDQVFANIAQQLAQYNPDSLSKPEKLAFYINAYNYYAIKIVVDNYPIDGIKDIGSIFSPVWKKKAGEINGKAVTLDQIEHDILRPMGEARIHFAIVCASMSCPDLRPEIFTATNLDKQLDQQTKNFLQNASKGAVVKNSELYLSEIFDWFEEDFEPHGGVLKFIANYRQNLESFKKFSTIDYNWELNRVRP